MNLLEVKNLSKKYKNFSLHNLTFSLPKGFILGVIGENGAGKTTTINCINHLCHADSGEIFIDGICYEENPIAYKERIGFIGDESYFPPEMTIGNIRSIQKDFYKSFHEDHFNHYIQQFELPDRKKIREFSRGMKVKLMFAVALSRDTRLLILDEATNGLDPIMRQQILQILQEYISDGEKSILFSTHILDDLEQIADYIAFIHKGKLILHGAKDDLLEDFVLVRGDNANISPELESHLIGLKKQEFSFEALVQTDDSIYIPKDFVIEQPTIDQIMIHLNRAKNFKLETTQISG